MRYEKPELEVIEMHRMDVVTQSQIDGESSGSGGKFGGNGEYPWE